MNEDIEDIEDIVKKNIIKLRKYCSKLIKPKKRVKKVNKQKVGNSLAYHRLLMGIVHCFSQIQPHMQCHLKPQ